jgi:hypothetical protein
LSITQLKIDQLIKHPSQQGDFLTSHTTDTQLTLSVLKVAPTAINQKLNQSINQTSVTARGHFDKTHYRNTTHLVDFKAGACRSLFMLMHVHLHVGQDWAFVPHADRRRLVLFCRPVPRPARLEKLGVEGLSVDS